jgi:hypothetical protein
MDKLERLGIVSRKSDHELFQIAADVRRSPAAPLRKTYFPAPRLDPLRSALTKQGWPGPTRAGWGWTTSLSRD